MAEQNVSIDEFLNARKHFVKGSGILVKSRSEAPRSWDPVKRSIRFVMSAEVEDRDRDIILQAGLSTDEFLKNPVAPLQHRSGTFPIGKWTDIEKHLNGRPKRTEGTLVLLAEGEDPDADRLAKHIEGGTIRACSIGFLPKTVVKRDIPDDKKDSGYYWPGYEVREAELVECSPVTIPANPAALAKMAADGDVFAKEVIEQVLDTWVKHNGVLMPREEFERAHKEATGERTSVLLPPGGVEKTTEGTNRPEEPSSDPVKEGAPSRSLVRRALDLLTNALSNEADAIAVAQAAVAEEERKEKEAAAVKAAAEQERQALEAQNAALEARLASKGLMNSAA